jgi:hypothetical protein
MTQPIDDQTLERFAESELGRQIHALVSRLQPEVTVERRHDERFAMPVLLELTPLDALGQPLANAATIVVGKDISRCGISFFHEGTLPYRRAIVSTEHPELGLFAAEIDINWCRFVRPGWYVSGGRLLRVLELETPQRRAQPKPASDSRRNAPVVLGSGIIPAAADCSTPVAPAR